LFDCHCRLLLLLLRVMSLLLPLLLLRVLGLLLLSLMSLLSPRLLLLLLWVLSLLLLLLTQVPLFLLLLPSQAQQTQQDLLRAQPSYSLVLQPAPPAQPLQLRQQHWATQPQGLTPPPAPTTP
jgi:hypothetical protein